MADPSTSVVPTPPADPAPPPAIGANALRIVLFGMPAAGKTSLLGALAQSAQTQEHLLNGRLADRSSGLAELQRRLYEELGRPTAEEVVPHAVEFEPFHPEGMPGPGKLEAALIDCDGRVANDLLARRRSLADDSPEGTLAREVLEADTLVLVVDAAAPPAQIDADFAEFGRFLRLLERGRGQRSEVGGLPVFLVLTKCDLLAQPNDTAVDWMERIEDRKRQVHQRFQDFLSRQTAEGGPLPFGRIDLHLWATAVKRPALGTTPAKPREPYGVAELFRQCLEYAAAFRQREQKSGRRLAWTVAAAGVVLGGMGTLIAALLLGGDNSRPTPLLAKVESYRSREGQTPSARLREPLQPKISELADLRKDPDFDKLPDELRAFVQTRLDELQAYHGYKEQLQHLRPLSSARNENDLREIEEALTTLTVPEAYQKDWSQTEAVLQRDERLRDIRALGTAVERVANWFEERKKQGKQLLLTPAAPNGETAWGAWHDQLRNLLEKASNPEFREGDPLPGSSGLTYAAVFRFTRVVEAQADWEAVRKRLEKVRDLAAALGLIAVPERPPLLAIPRPPEFSVDDARARVLDLQRAYPGKDQLTLPDDLPEGITLALRKAAGPNYENLLEAGRREVDKQLKRRAGADRQETPRLWQQVRDWLEAPEELAAWRTLARVLGRLHSPDWADPLEELIAFLKKDRFEVDLRRPILKIPIGLDVRPAGKLAVRHSRPNLPDEVLFFEVADESTDTLARVRTYVLRPEGEGRVVAYQPGEELWGLLAVERGGGAGWGLAWNRGRSAVFQFVHLTTAPQLYQGQDSRQGEAAQGVTLTFTTPSGAPGVPPLPELIPVVKLK